MLINKTLTKLSALIIGSMLLTVLNTVSAKQVTLNLKQTDIHSLVETVAEVTGKNFVVDPRVIVEIMLQQDEKNGMVMAKIILTRE